MNGWDGRKVLVTGADGFIGSHLTAELARRGAEVRALSCYNSFNQAGWLDDLEPDVRGRVEVFQGDVRDANRMVDACAGRDAVFHLAALIGIPYSYLAPDSYVQVNVHGTLNVLNGARRADVRTFVQTSTSEVYGTARRVPIDEDHPLQPQSPYSASKIGADALAISYQRSFGLPVAVVRPFNTFGPRQSARAVIPTIASQLWAGARAIKLGARAPTRDFNYVEDTVRGFLAVAECARAVGEVVNVGTGRETSVGEVAETLMKVTGRSAEIVEDPARVRRASSEVERLLCDNRRIREWTGWSPQVPLDEGLRRTAEWVRTHMHAFKPEQYNV